MAETTQYTFQLKEVTEALIKQQGIDSGVWDCAVEFGLTAGLMGANPDAAMPTALLQITKLILLKHGDGLPFNPTTVDAGQFNTRPVPKHPKK